VAAIAVVYEKERNSGRNEKARLNQAWALISFRAPCANIYKKILWPATMLSYLFSHIYAYRFMGIVFI